MPAPDCDLQRGLGTNCSSRQVHAAQGVALQHCLWMPLSCPFTSGREATTYFDELCSSSGRAGALDLAWLSMVKIAGSFQVTPLSSGCGKENRNRLSLCRFDLGSVEMCGFCGFLLTNLSKYDFLWFGNNGLSHGRRNALPSKSRWCLQNALNRIC